MLSRTHGLATLCLLALTGASGCGSNESSPTTGSPRAGSGGSPASSGGTGAAGSGGTSGGGATGGAAGSSVAGSGGSMGGAAGGSVAGNGGTSGSAGAPSGGLGGASTTVSYARDVQPLFQPCVYCHYTGNPVLVDIERPFAPTTGVVNTPNAWLADHPEGNTPARDVMPGDPDQSFLIWKLGGHPPLDEATAGSLMPWAVPRLTADELASLRAWITAGAPNDQSFTDDILPIFGIPGRLGRSGGKCTYCHFPGGQSPDLSNPFDPDVGVVGLPAAEAQGMKLIEPGNPDASFLVVKVTSTTLPRIQGLPMPAQFPALTAAELETVRTWIRQGAQNN